MRSFCIYAVHLELTECHPKKLLDLHNQKWIQEHKCELHELQQIFFEKKPSIFPKNQKTKNSSINLSTNGLNNIRPFG